MNAHLDTPLTPVQQALVLSFRVSYPNPFRALIRCYPGTWRLARHAAKLPVDEIEAACWLGVCRAATRYDPGRGTTFATVAVLWMRSAVQQRAKQAARARTYERQDEHLDRHAESTDPESSGDLWEQVERLPKMEREAITLYYRDGLTLAEIGARSGVTRERARQRVVSGVGRLRA